MALFSKLDLHDRSDHHPNEDLLKPTHKLFDYVHVPLGCELKPE